jgi:membrane protein implicated in regulation of membrane protease activity
MRFDHLFSADFISSKAALAALVWFAGALSLFLLEMTAPGLYYFISLGCGALAASIGSLFDASLFVQLALCTAGSSISFFILKKIGSRHHHATTNVQALIGKEAHVERSIEPQKVGLVRVGREIWSATAEHHTTLHKGTVVKVIRVQGNKVIVRPL